jgi:hypothetical protein
MTTLRVGKKIFDDILSGMPKPKTPLYHYTTQRGLSGIVGTREIWATHHQCLNDTEEFIHAKDLFRREIDERADAAGPANNLLADMKRTLEGKRGFEDVNLYVASFSADCGDSLSQWRAYGGPTSGFSLGFEMDEIALPSRFKLVRCEYDEAKQREIIKSLVTQLLDGFTELSQEVKGVRTYVDSFCRTELHQLALLFKHWKFSEEREWRIISSEPMMEDPPSTGEAPLGFREGKSMLIPYRRVPLMNNMNHFPLTEVVVGPNPNPEQSVRSVCSLLKSYHLTNIKPRMSEVPYRNW